MGTVKLFVRVLAIIHNSPSRDSKCECFLGPSNNTGSTNVSQQQHLMQQQQQQYQQQYHPHPLPQFMSQVQMGGPNGPHQPHSMLVGAYGGVAGAGGPTPPPLPGAGPPFARPHPSQQQQQQPQNPGSSIASLQMVWSLLERRFVPTRGVGHDQRNWIFGQDNYCHNEFSTKMKLSVTAYGPNTDSAKFYH